MEPKTQPPTAEPEHYLFAMPRMYPFQFWYPARTPTGDPVRVYEKAFPHVWVVRVDTPTGLYLRPMKFAWWFPEANKTPEAVHADLVARQRRPTPLKPISFRDMPAWHCTYRQDAREHAVFIVPFGRRLCTVTVDQTSGVAQQVLASLEFFDPSKPPGQPPHTIPLVIGPTAELVGWRLFTHPQIPVQFHYPPRTRLRAEVRCDVDQVFGVSDLYTVYCKSVGTDELDFEIAQGKSVQILSKVARTQPTTEPITRVTFGGIPAEKTSYQRGQRKRTVIMLTLHGYPCAVSFDSDSLEAQQIAATLEFT